MARKPPASKRREARRKRLYRIQKGLCAGCKQPHEIDRMTFDHRFPQSKAEAPTKKDKKKAGKRLRSVDDFRNIELLCRPCNAFKADNWPWDWNAYVWDEYTRSLKSRAEIDETIHRKVYHKKSKPRTLLWSDFVNEGGLRPQEDKVV